MQYCLADGYEVFEEGFGEVEAQHVGAVALGMGGVGVRLHEDAVGTHGDGGAGDGLYHVGTAAGDAGEWVMSTTTGTPFFCIVGTPRKSTTRSW